MPKRKGILLLVVVSLLLLAVGCQKKADETMLIKLFIGRSGLVPPPDNKLLKLVEKEFNVKFQIEFLVGELEEKLGIMIAGEDYADLVWAHSKLIEAGAVIPLEDLIEKNCPRLYAHYKPFWNRVKETKDGHFYFMPNFGRVYNNDWTGTHYGSAMFLQKAVLKEFNYPRPKTLDEYFDLIQKYVAKYPTIDGKPTIGFSILCYDWRAFCLTNPPEFLSGNPNDGGVIVDKTTFKAEIFADKEVAKRYYKKLNEMNALGIIDKESFVQNYDQYLAKIASGRVVGMHDQYWQFEDAAKSLIAQERYDRTYAPLGITYDKDTKDWYRDRALLNLMNGFGISKKCKDPLRILKMLDTLLEEKWQKILNWGIEGEDYLVNDKGRFYRTPEMRKIQAEPAWENNNRLRALIDFPKIEGMYNDGNSSGPGNQPEEFFDGLVEYDKEMLKKYNMNSFIEFLNLPPENPKYYPAWQVTLVDGSEAQIVNKQIDEHNKKYLPRVILAKPADFEAVWQEYVDGFKKINVKAYEDRINEEIQWRLKNW